MTISNADQFVVSLEEAHVRLDKLLSLHFPQHSRTYFQMLIEKGCVLVSGKPMKKREKPEAGDEIEICFLLTPEISLEAQDIPLDILHEDEHLLIINKPVGMVVHPAPGHPNGTFVNALLHHCKWNVPENDLRPGIVHRLDKDTSGILIAAKTAETHQKLVTLFCERKIQKYYYALTLGNPGDGEINAPIGRHPVRRKEMAIVDTGKEAITRCKVIATKENISLLELELITGRTHQIRVHLKHKGTPILGDPVYGSPSANQKYGVSVQQLHAHRVCFTHPMTGKTLVVSAPIPYEMRRFLE